jgi:choline dehydrogenase-like flavoprotein
VTASHFDAIVVGTGMAGGMAAKELTERGLHTLALERGRDLPHGTGYVTEHVPSWELPGRGRVPETLAAEHYPVQRRTYVFSEFTRHFFARDTDHPVVEDAPFSWIQTDVVGGRSLLWARQSYRWGPKDFTANRDDGHGVDWPLRYADLAPWYGHVERFVGISGSSERLPQLPDGEFLPPMGMNAAERHARAAIETAFPDRRLIIGRSATLTAAHNGRAACHYCGPCERGCSTASYYSSNGVALPAARATGRLTLKPNALVESVTYDAASNRATGVRVIDTQTREVIEYRARVVFLCASALGSVRIMQNSVSDAFPTGIANSSGALGRYLMDHHCRVGATGHLGARLRDRYYRGHRPNGVYIPRFRNLGAGNQNPGFLRGYGVQGGAERAGWGRGAGRPGLGADFKHSLRDPGPWTMWLQAFGETLPRAENRCWLDAETKDAWGMPALRVRLTRDANDAAMRDDMAATTAEMLAAAEFEDIIPWRDDAEPPGTNNHEMGGARMGRDPASSVLDGHNRCHDVPNLFVTDGACMTSSACQNPSLTYLALTARASAWAVEQLKQGKL